MKLMQKTVWAITPEMLSTMVSIAHQTNKSPEAIAKEMGRDMKNTYAVSTRGGVAVIPVTGPLFRHANLLTAVCGATSYELLAQDFNKALNDPKISAILFDVDSPGGEVNGCSELAEMIYKARGKKPIIAYASGSCCSGAYWIASACDKIMAADTAILGSIGVVSIFEKEDEKRPLKLFPLKARTSGLMWKQRKGKPKSRLTLMRWQRFLLIKLRFTGIYRRKMSSKTSVAVMFLWAKMLSGSVWRTA